MQQKVDTKNKKVKLLVIGDSNYNNVRKFDIKLTQIIQSLNNNVKIGTFGQVYGAQLLATLYAEQNNIDYVSFDKTWFKRTKKNNAQLYHILIGIAVKWVDIVIIFSNVYTDKIKKIIKDCQKKNIPYLIIKE